MTKSTLGRGLGSLIPVRDGNRSNGEAASRSGERVEEIDVQSIQPNPHQPRERFDRAQLEELVSSIKVHGIIQPLIVLTARDGYQLIAGERRLRAAKILGLRQVPVIKRSVSEQEKLELAIVENVQRQNLNPIEKAHAYSRLMEEFSLTQEEVGRKVGQGRAVVANALRLLNLPQHMQAALQDGIITEGHAKVLLGVKLESERERIFKEIAANSLSVRLTESRARQVTVRKHTRRTSKDPNLVEKEQLLQEALGTRVEIKRQVRGGTISIHFYSGEELGGIIRKITQ